MFNDNGIFEYILQDDIFMGVLGMLECELPIIAFLTRQMIPSSQHLKPRIGRSSVNSRGSVKLSRSRMRQYATRSTRRLDFFTSKMSCLPGCSTTQRSVSSTALCSSTRWTSHRTFKAMKCSYTSCSSNSGLQTSPTIPAGMQRGTILCSSCTS